MAKRTTTIDHTRAASSLIGVGHLHAAGQAAQSVAYHLVGWGVRGESHEAFHWCGTIRRLDQGTFDDIADREDVALELLQNDLWWPCMVGVDGWVSTRHGAHMGTKNGHSPEQESPAYAGRGIADARRSPGRSAGRSHTKARAPASNASVT
jgi:hypothetical protein